MKTIHLDQQLIQGLLALVVGATSPAPLRRPTASISSTKMMHGATRLAWSKRSRTRLAPTPTNISTNSEPEMLKNGTPASPATARLSSVLPVPGGPTSSTPLGMRSPMAANFSGYLRNSTISYSSSFASAAPATSSNVIFCAWATNLRARLRPKPMPGPRRIVMKTTPPIISVSSTTGTTSSHATAAVSSTSYLTVLSSWLVTPSVDSICGTEASRSLMKTYSASAVLM